MHSSLAVDLRAIRSIPLLTLSEELFLAARIQAWLCLYRLPAAESLLGRRALNRTLTANLRLVVSLCLRQQRLPVVPGIDLHQIHLADLMQAGSLGLIKAVRRCDPRGGDRASTFGSCWIHQTIHAHLRDLSCRNRLPERVREVAHKASALQSLSPQALNVDPLARQLGLRERVVLSPRYLELQRPGLQRVAERTGLKQTQTIHGEERALRPLRSRFHSPAPELACLPPPPSLS